MSLPYYCAVNLRRGVKAAGERLSRSLGRLWWICHWSRTRKLRCRRQCLGCKLCWSIHVKHFLLNWPQAASLAASSATLWPYRHDFLSIEIGMTRQSLTRLCGRCVLSGNWPFQGNWVESGHIVASFYLWTHWPVLTHCLGEPKTWQHRSEVVASSVKYWTSTGRRGRRCDCGIRRRYARLCSKGRIRLGFSHAHTMDCYSSFSSHTPANQLTNCYLY